MKMMIQNSVCVLYAFAPNGYEIQSYCLCFPILKNNAIPGFRMLEASHSYIAVMGLRGKVLIVGGL